MAKEYSYGICPYTIINGDFHILLNKTSEVSFWNFFKGKIEKDETITECAIREFQEETGILVSHNDLEKFYVQQSSRKDIGVYLVDFTKYQNLEFKFQKKEIWTASWINVNKEVDVSRNQQKVYNDMLLDFYQRNHQLSNLVKQKGQEMNLMKLEDIRYKEDTGQPQYKLEQDFTTFGYIVVNSKKGHNAVEISHPTKKRKVIVEQYLLYRHPSSEVTYRLMGDTKTVQYKDIIAGFKKPKHNRVIKSNKLNNLFEAVESVESLTKEDVLQMIKEADEGVL